MKPNPPSIPSPCVRNCCLDEDDICMGCFRSMAEIMAWSQSDATARADILARAAKRRAKRKR